MGFETQSIIKKDRSGNRAVLGSDSKPLLGFVQSLLPPTFDWRCSRVLGWGRGFVRELSVTACVGFGVESHHFAATDLTAAQAFSVAATRALLLTNTFPLVFRTKMLSCLGVFVHG